MSAATYFLIQHFANPFRHEARNVGLIVEKDGYVAAKFHGEKDSGSVDRRKLKGFDNPGAYIQWVEYWRYELASGPKGIDSISKASGANFRLMPPAELQSLNGETPDQVLNRLYPTLVGEHEPETSSQTHLEQAMEAAFAAIGILAIRRQPPLHVRFPIQRKQRVGGERLSHHPDFLQDAGKLFVIESIEGTLQRNRLIERAAHASYMYNDIRKANSSVRTISVVSHLPSDGSAHDALQIIQDASDSVVNWEDEGERQHFLDERRAVAYG